MKQLEALGMLVLLALGGAALAQTEAAQEGQQDAARHPTHSTPATEGTAADRTPPGETPTHETRRPTVDPEPATEITEGTAADSTTPGEASASGSARIAAAGEAQVSLRASQIIGMKVRTSTGESLGEVEDIVLDDGGRASELIVSRSATGGGSRLATLPWREAMAIIRADALVIDRQRLENAKSFDGGS